MKPILSEKILKETDLDYETVSMILKSGTLKEFKTFPDKIMSGTVGNGEVSAVINSPAIWVDPFKSRVEGVYKHIGERTVIDLEVKFSWLIIIFYLFWYSLSLVIFVNMILKGFNFRFEDILIFTVNIIVPAGLGRLKLNWDKRRLENWIQKKINTVPNIT